MNRDTFNKFFEEFLRSGKLWEDFARHINVSSLGTCPNPFTENKPSLGYVISDDPRDNTGGINWKSNNHSPSAWTPGLFPYLKPSDGNDVAEDDTMAWLESMTDDEIRQFMPRLGNTHP